MVNVDGLIKRLKVKAPVKKRHVSVSVNAPLVKAVFDLCVCSSSSVIFLTFYN